ERGPARVQAALAGQGWTSEHAPEGVPALVRRSPDGAWVAALLWEQRETSDPARGLLSPGLGAAGRSLRGRLYLFRGDVATLQERWSRTDTEWQHARPYRMPVERPAERAR